MKLTLALGAVLLLCALASAVPADKPGASTDLKDAIKNAKEQKKAKEACTKACTMQYDPVCAHDPANPSAKAISFGSECVLQNHNCEHGANLTVKTKGECPGSSGVRLS